MPRRILTILMSQLPSPAQLARIVIIGEQVTMQLIFITIIMTPGRVIFIPLTRLVRSRDEKLEVLPVMKVMTISQGLMAREMLKAQARMRSFLLLLKVFSCRLKLLKEATYKVMQEIYIKRQSNNLLVY